MARTTQQFEMGGKEVVLGLLIERPGTRYQLENRISERFGSAGFGRGTARQAMKRLYEQGFIDARKLPDSSPGQASDTTPKITYEATQAGIEYFSSWVRASVSMPPVREDLHAKIAFCGPDDLPEMIKVVREAEVSCMVMLRGLNWRMQSERQPEAMQDWKERLGMIVMAGDSAWWGGRIKWLQDVRMYLERELQSHRPPDSAAR
jgi:DNA-binding PadR family transcriptional regulator